MISWGVGGGEGHELISSVKLGKYLLEFISACVSLLTNVHQDPSREIIIYEEKIAYEVNNNSYFSMP